MELKHGEDIFKELFDKSPIALYLQDFSKVSRVINELQIQDTVSLKSYLLKHPNLVSTLMQSVTNIKVNHTAVILYHADSAQQLLKNFDERLVKDDVQHFIDQVVAITSGIDEYEGEARNLDLNGEVMNLIVKKKVINRKKNGLSMILTSIIDDTERKKAEERLKKSEEQYREIVEGTDNLVTEVDADGRLIFVNGTSRKVFGLEPEECIGRLAFDFIHPDDREQTLLQFEQWVNKKARSVTFENRQMSQLGSVRDMLWTINFHYDSSGEILSIRSIARDITERKRVETQLKRYHDQLEAMVAERTSKLKRANEKLTKEILDRKRAEIKMREYADTQSVLVREVNHRVKNNLSAIIGMLQMEQHRTNTDGLNLYLPILNDLIGRIRGLTTVHSLLSSAGWRPLEVGKLCQEIVSATLQGIPLGKHIDFEITPSQEQINSNQAHHLTMVIHELTTNTMKYALKERQHACINIEIDQNETTMRILFKDNGPGYPDYMLQEDFHPSSVGFELIRGITQRSLQGSVYLSNDNGAATCIIFENELVHKEERITQ